MRKKVPLPSPYSLTRKSPKKKKKEQREREENESRFKRHLTPHYQETDTDRAITISGDRRVSDELLSILVAFFLYTLYLILISDFKNHITTFLSDFH